jgi:glutamate racemase
VPYTGVVVHAAQAACALSQGGRIGVIGTTAAIRSGLYGKVIRNIRPDARVLGNSCPLFVPLVENGLIDRDNEITRLTAQMYLRPLLDQKIDTLILGCTHFPVIYDIISDVTNFEVTLIDSGRETARYAKSFLMENDLLSDREESAGCVFMLPIRWRISPKWRKNI